MQKKFEIVSKNRKFQGHFAIDVYKVRYEKFEGGFTLIIQREVFERGSAAGVLPYDPVRQEVVLIEQFRVGAVNNTKKTPWLFETVAGIIEEGETVEEVIHREAEEEAGLKIQKLIPLYHYFATPGGSTEEIHLFCGIVDAAQADGIHGLDEESEDIKVHVFSLQEAFQWLEDGKINNAMAIIALQWLQIHWGEL